MRLRIDVDKKIVENLIVVNKHIVVDVVIRFVIDRDLEIAVFC